MNWSNLGLTRRDRDEIFIPAGLRDGMKNSGGRQDWKSLFLHVKLTYLDVQVLSHERQKCNENKVEHTRLFCWNLF